MIANTGITRKSPQPPSPSTIIEIAARHVIEPYRQGELDCLCGLYSAVNAIKLACEGLAPLSKVRAKQLFEHGADLLQRKHAAAEAMAAGMSPRRWRGIVRLLARNASSARIAVELERPDFSVKPTIEQIFAWIEASIAAGKPVLIHLAKGIGHYTAVAGITPTRLLLFDSCGQRFIKRASCGAAESYHRIPPKALLRIAVSRRG